MDRMQKLELFRESKGKFVKINDYSIYSKRKLLIKGKIEYVDTEKGEITLRNLKINSIRNISIDSFNDFVIEPLNNHSHSETAKNGGGFL